MHGNDGAQIDHYDVAEFVERDAAVPAQILRCLLPEVGPADQGGHGEGAQGDREKRIPHIGQMGEGGCGQVRLGGACGGCRVVEHVAHHHKPGQQAHHYGVPENGGHGHIRLYFGIVGVGGGCGDGGSADPCLVGEQPSGNAVPHGTLQAGARHAPGKTGEGKCVLYDPDHGCDKLVTVEEEKNRAASQVQKGDGRYSPLAEVSDAADAADDDCGCDHGEGNADRMGGNPETQGCRSCDGVCLRGAAHAESGC